MKQLYILIFILSLATLGFAQTSYYWVGNYSPRWEDSQNWQPVGTPTANDDVAISSTGEYNPYISSHVTCNNLNANSSTSVIVLEGYSLTVNGNLSTSGHIVLSDNANLEVKGNATWHSGSTIHPYITTQCVFHKDLTLKWGSSFVYAFLGDGRVVFTGGSNSVITIENENTYLKEVIVAKTSSTATVTVAEGNDFNMTKLVIQPLNRFIVNTTATITFTDSGTDNRLYPWIEDQNTGSSTTYGLKHNAGTFNILGFSIPNPTHVHFGGKGSYFNNLIVGATYGFAPSDNFNYPMVVNGDFTIRGGINIAINDLRVGRHWENTSTNTQTYPQKVTFFNGKNAHPIVKSTQAFNTLVTDTDNVALRFASGVDVSCQLYSSTSGGIDVNTNANFIVGGFTNPSNRISGRWYITHEDAMVHISNSISPSFSGYLEMRAGVLQLNNLGFNTVASNTSTVTGGTIVCEGVYIQSTFQPTGGAIRLQSTKTSSELIYVQDGSWLFDLIVEPVSRKYLLYNDLTLKGSFILESGEFEVVDPISDESHTMYVGENWINNRGPDYFHEGQGTVVFNGPGYQACKTDEDFYTIHVDKTPPGGGGNAFRIESPTSGVYLNVTCQNYKWLAGALDVNRRSTLTIHNVLNSSLMGKFYCYTNCQLNIFASNTDLNGSLHVLGGEVNITNTSTGATISSMQSGSLRITVGNLNFTNTGLRFPDTPSFTTSISGGTVSLVNHFLCERNDFNPSGGTFYIKGATDSTITFSSDGSYFYHLVIDKEDEEAVVQTNSPLSIALECKGLIQIEKGEFKISGHVFKCHGQIIVYNPGKLTLLPGATLKMADNRYIGIYNDARFTAMGDISNKATITGIDSDDYYSIDVNSGGIFNANYAKFSNLGDNGVYLINGSICESLNNCEFSNGIAGGTLLRIENAQDLTLDNISFPVLPADNSNKNVTKTDDRGTVKFTNYSGDFGGYLYENDPHDRIYWLGDDVDFMIDDIVLNQTDPYVCGTLTPTVIIKNVGTNDYLGRIRVDFYKNEITYPRPGAAGDYYGFVENLAPGKVKHVSIPPMTSEDAITWSCYAQVDALQLIPETNEQNNIYGPIEYVWQPLPAVSNLRFTDLVGDSATMKWDYEAPFNRFVIYRCDDPLFPPASTVIQTTSDTTEKEMSLFQPRSFYRVTARRNPPNLD